MDGQTGIGNTIIFLSEVGVYKSKDQDKQCYCILCVLSIAITHIRFDLNPNKRLS